MQYSNACNEYTIQDLFVFSTPGYSLKCLNHYKLSLQFVLEHYM